MSGKQHPAGSLASGRPAPAPLPPCIVARDGGCVLRVHVQPRAKKPGPAGLHGDRLKLRVSQPPSDGAANAACAALLARLLDTAPSRVALLRGASNRDKEFAVEGIDGPAAAARLGAYLQ